MMIVTTILTLVGAALIALGGVIAGSMFMQSSADDSLAPFLFPVFFIGVGLVVISLA